MQLITPNILPVHSRQRVILHADLNHFYASVETYFQPELARVPLAVGGDPEARHGIVLTKNPIAKKFGIKTGEPLWEAKKKCPALVVVRPHYDRYIQFANAVRSIYEQYTDQVESFGIDEAWMEVTGSEKLFGEGVKIADEIRRRICDEIGITVSVGVSWNKVFAKLGSDLKKPNATTVITRQNMEEKVWPLDIGELLYVGPAMQKKFRRYGINTVGDIARSNPAFLLQQVGKAGQMFWTYANGLDDAPVHKSGYNSAPKSIGNSSTTRRDLLNIADARVIFTMLAEEIAQRMREDGYKGRGLQIYVRDNQMEGIERQTRLLRPTYLTNELVDTACQLLEANWKWERGIRTLGIRMFDLQRFEVEQMSMLPEEAKRLRWEMLERAVDGLRERHGRHIAHYGALFSDNSLYEPHVVVLRPPAPFFVH